MIRILLSACQMKGVKLWTRLVVFWDATRLRSGRLSLRALISDDREVHAEQVAYKTSKCPAYFIIGINSKYSTRVPHFLELGELGLKFKLLPRQ